MKLFRIYLDDMAEEEPRQQPEAVQTQTMYGVVLDLPDEFSEEVETNRLKYSPQAAKSIFPHITLRSPFTVEDSRSIISILEDIALKYLPVKVEASDLGTFKGHRNNVLYTRVNRSDRLLRLHEALVRGLTQVQDIFPDAKDHQLNDWVPHITIADGMAEAELDQLYDELRDYKPQCEWEAREMLLVRSESAPDGSLLWTTTRAFRAPS